MSRVASTGIALLPCAWLKISSCLEKKMKFRKQVELSWEEQLGTLKEPRSDTAV